jgi:hypothetical protein
LCNGGHPGIGLDCKDIGAAFNELARGNPRAGAHIENTASTTFQKVVDELVGVARTVCVIAVCRATK